MNLWVVVLIAIVITIILGFKTNINIGFYAIGSAYFIGCFAMDMKPKEVLGLWPLDIFFILFSVSYFYEFAIQNGTLEKLASNIMYRFRRRPTMLPFAIFFVALMLAAMGAGFYAVLAFIVPFAMIICEKTGMKPVVGVMAASGGSVSGGKFIISVSGKIVESLVLGAGYSQAEAAKTVMSVFITSTIMELAIVTTLFIVYKQWKVVKVELDMPKPEPFNRDQKINLYLIFTMIVLVLGPYILGLFVQNDTLSFIQSKLDISFVAIVLSVVALLFKIGDEKKLFKALPWSTIIMISGVGIMIALGVKGGLIEALTEWVGSNIPDMLVPIIMTVVAGIMSVFSSTTGVVLPTLYPMVPALSAASGVAPMVLFSVINLGSISTGISPFSSGGGISLSSCPTEESRQQMMKILLVLPFACLLFAVAMAIIMSFIF